MTAGETLPARIWPATVSLSLRQYRPVYVGGAVRAGGAFPFLPGLTARQAVLLAGGAGRMPDAALRRLELEATLAPLEARRVAAADRLERLRQELDPDRRGPARLPETERAILAERRGQDVAAAAHFARAIRHTQAQMDDLAAQLANETEGMAGDRLDFERIEEMREAGTATALRLSDARRALLFSTTRQLQTATELARTTRELGSVEYEELRRTLDLRLEAVSGVAAATQLVAELDAQIAAAAPPARLARRSRGHAGDLGHRQRRRHLPAGPRGGPPAPPRRPRDGKPPRGPGHELTGFVREEAAPSDEEVVAWNWSAPTSSRTTSRPPPSEIVVSSPTNERPCMISATPMPLKALKSSRSPASKLRTMTSPPTSWISMSSSPSPPSRMSIPGPPISTSSPAPPSRMSLPSPPMITSSPAPPSTVSWMAPAARPDPSNTSSPPSRLTVSRSLAASAPVIVEPCREAEHGNAARVAHGQHHVVAVRGLLHDAVRRAVADAAEPGEVEVDLGHAGAAQVVDDDAVGAAERVEVDRLDLVQVHQHVRDVAEEERPPPVGRDVDGLGGVRAVEEHGVEAGLALEHVVVVARVPDEGVVARPHERGVVAVAAVEEVVAAAAEEDVVAEPAVHRELEAAGLQPARVDACRRRRGR